MVYVHISQNALNELGKRQPVDDDPDLYVSMRQDLMTNMNRYATMLADWDINLTKLQRKYRGEEYRYELGNLDSSRRRLHNGIIAMLKMANIYTEDENLPYIEEIDGDPEQIDRSDITDAITEWQLENNYNDANVFDKDLKVISTDKTSPSRIMSDYNYSVHLNIMPLVKNKKNKYEFIRLMTGEKQPIERVHRYIESELKKDYTDEQKQKIRKSFSKAVDLVKNKEKERGPEL